MPQSLFLKSITLLICLCSFTGNVSAATSRVSLKNAMLRNLITVNAISNGGYRDRSIKLDIANNTSGELTIDMDPALIFIPEDTIYQNLVLLGNEALVLAPNASKTVDLQTYCGKSYAECPVQGIKYHYWKQGDSNLIKTLVYAKQYDIESHLTQLAVWTFTNGYCLNSIYCHYSPRVSETFMKYVSSLFKSPIPDYFKEYTLDDEPGRSVIASGGQKTYVNMHWGNEGYRQMYVAIYKENGDVYRKIEADQVIDKYGHTISVCFDPINDPKGVYYVRLHDETRKVWEQKRVVIGADQCSM